MILLFYFNPIIKGLRGITQASQLERLQKELGCSRASLGSLSEAAAQLDSEPLREIIGELAQKALPITVGKEAEALRGLTAVDGSLLPALAQDGVGSVARRRTPRRQNACAFRCVQGRADGRHGDPRAAAAENEQLRNMLLPKRLYVIDRGYGEYQLFQDIIDAGSSFIGRIKDNAAFEVLEERPITTEAKAAGVIRDVIVKRLGTEHHKNVLKQSVRIVIVATGKTDSNGQPDVLILATDRLDLAAELVALAYKYRWSVRTLFSLAQVHFGLSPSAGNQPKRRGDPSLLGNHRQPVDQPLDRQEADPADLGDASVLLQRLGHLGGIAGPHREIERPQVISHATASPRWSALFAAAQRLVNSPMPVVAFGCQVL